ncbi:YqeG family HAD IIIA-type phosphatase [Salinibacillus xinjiangensis]|uniref:YqeG family HAD IIIA-type phosphatase n=1 Tax=Salinibacillus xinjiangensis TaxID=1229268 RepID=A0A6G1X785_9BACI|nr:YqeG family HAD IIIA-type phosphatase [Salinibacillus xinjiangensis]MRG86668.1 YqeG family HAD IIIA-type phosphatase [Salinibacillus xinjiangensis]
MLKRFLPNEHVKTVFEVTPEELKEKGINGIITDLDNTLVAWDQKDATPEIIEWFKLMKDHGIQVTVMSNNNEERVRHFSKPLDIPFIYKARKPLSRAFRKAQKAMNLPKDQIVVVGDQLLTDVLGGNSAKFYTILVVPVVKTDGVVTKFNRRIERMLLNWFRKKGLITWEE